MSLSFKNLWKSLFVNSVRLSIWNNVRNSTRTSANSVFNMPQKDCCICGKKSLLKLSNHLADVHQLSLAERQMRLIRAKYEFIIQSRVQIQFDHFRYASNTKGQLIWEELRRNNIDIGEDTLSSYLNDCLRLRKLVVCLANRRSTVTWSKHVSHISKPEGRVQ